MPKAVSSVTRESGRGLQARKLARKLDACCWLFSLACCLADTCSRQTDYLLSHVLTQIWRKFSVIQDSAVLIKLVLKYGVRYLYLCLRHSSMSDVVKFILTAFRWIFKSWWRIDIMALRIYVDTLFLEIWKMQLSFEPYLIWLNLDEFEMVSKFVLEWYLSIRRGILGKSYWRVSLMTIPSQCLNGGKRMKDGESMPGMVGL